MAISHPTYVRDRITDLVVDLLDSGGSGTIKFLGAFDSDIATCTFGVPAFGSSSNGTAIANAISDDTNANGGNVTKFVAFSGAGDSCFSGTVSTSGADINLSSTLIGATDTVRIESLQYTAPL